MTRTDRIFIGIILFVSIAIYSNAIFNGFVFDDKIQVLKNALIKDIKNIPEIFTSGIVYSDEHNFISNNYRPVMNLIFMFNYYVYGLKAWGFHLNNIMIHAGASVLVFIIIIKLLKKSSQIHVSSLPAFVAALLFATHPIHTEAVAWVSGVPELSYTFFSLLAFYLYIRAREGVRLAYPFSVVSFALATLCKETALTLPIIFIAYDFVNKKEGDPLSDYIKKYLAYIVVLICYIVIRYYALNGFAPRQPNIQLAGYVYFINIFPLFSQYLEKLLLPINLNKLYVFHPIFSVLEMRGVVSIAITVAFVIFSVISLRRKKQVFLGTLFIAVPLIPVLFMYRSLGAFAFTERYLYLPSLGFVLIIALGLSWIQANKPKLSLVLIIITMLVIGLYSVGTISRNSVWKDEYTLYSDIAKKSPDSYYVRNYMGLVYADQGRINDAISEFKAAIKLKPDFANAHYNLGVAYISLGRSAEAINEFKIALHLKPDFIEARQMLYFLLKK